MRALSLAVAVLAALTTPAAATEPAAVSDFFVGGRYLPDRSAMVDQAHVLALTPRHRRHRLPVIFIPGMGQTVTNFLATPDGRPGWAQQFLDAGYAVYLMDQPGRGNGGYNAAAYGPPERQTPLFLAQRFTAPEKFPVGGDTDYGWPQAKHHTQWPGTGEAGDPAFDQFYASQVESMSGAKSAELVPLAGAALLDRIGPAIVLTHSQSGPFGWAIGEARPRLVKAIVAIEPGGPPFVGAPHPWGDTPAPKIVRPFGITSTPLAYAPALKTGQALVPEQQAAPDAPDLARCWLQKAPARRLVNFKMPVLIVTSEASYHAGYDHCTAKYMVQAGARTDFVRLEQAGIRGNAHMMMLEKNNAAISNLLLGWLGKQHLD